MHIVFTGPHSHINEWAKQCKDRGHELYAAFGEADEKLDASVEAFTDVNAPSVDLIVDLYLEDVAQKATRLDTLCIMTRRHVPMLSNTVFVTATELAKHVKYPELLVGMAYLPTMMDGQTVELALPYGLECESLHVMEEFIASIGKTPVMVGDYAGMVFPRVIATIVNEAVYTLQQGVAGREAIDTAMKLGVNYPDGPMHWGERIGFATILKLLRVLQDEYGDDRYRPAPLLKKLA